MKNNFDKRPLQFYKQEIQIPKIKETIDTRLEQTKLNETQKTQLKKWFHKKVSGTVKRQKDNQDGKKITQASLDAILNHALGMLEVRINIAEENRERLNPQLLTKKGMENEIKSHLSSTAKKKQNFVLVAMDLDDFKTINDTSGHQEGDNVLRSFGAAISDNIRTGDLGAHYSGDEFGILLFVQGIPNEKQEETQERIQEILKRAIESISEKTERQDKKKQEISTGYRIITPDEQKTSMNIATWMKEADEASTFSKRMKIILEKRGENSNSASRIVNAQIKEKMPQEFSEEEIKFATLLHSIHRPLRDTFPTTTDFLDSLSASSRIITKN